MLSRHCPSLLTEDPPRVRPDAAEDTSHYAEFRILAIGVWQRTGVKV